MTQQATIWILFFLLVALFWFGVASIWWPGLFRLAIIATVGLIIGLMLTEFIIWRFRK